LAYGQNALLWLVSVDGTAAMYDGVTGRPVDLSRFPARPAVKAPSFPVDGPIRLTRSIHEGLGGAGAPPPRLPPHPPPPPPPPAGDRGPAPRIRGTEPVQCLTTTQVFVSGGSFEKSGLFTAVVIGTPTGYAVYDPKTGQPVVGLGKKESAGKWPVPHAAAVRA